MSVKEAIYNVHVLIAKMQTVTISSYLVLLLFVFGIFIILEGILGYWSSLS